MRSLQDLGRSHGTDKADSTHTFLGESYLHVYARYLAPLRDEPIRLLELGVKNGASLRMWKEYFPNGRVWGVDINPNCQRHTEHRIEIVTASQDDRTALGSLSEAVGGFDVIVDDASHINVLTVASYRILFPNLRAGGFYFIEDLGMSRVDLAGFTDDPAFMDGEHLANRARGVDLRQRRDVLDELFEEILSAMDSRRGPVRFLHFYSQMAVIQKREAPVPGLEMVCLPERHTGRVVQPRSPGATHGDVPWQPWDVSRVTGARSTTGAAPDLLRIVTERPKRNLTSVADVPPELVTLRELSTSTDPPRSVRPLAPEPDWLPQFRRVALLHLPGGFIGDNVVFDRDRYYSFGQWWLGDRRDSWELYRGTSEVVHIDAGVSIGACGGEAFQLFILDALPKLAAVIDLLETPQLAHVKIVSHDDEAPAARWFWKKLGLLDRVVQKPKNARAGFVVHADLVLATHYDPPPGYYGLHPRGCLGPIQRRLGTLEPRTRDLVVYLRRTGRRTVANESLLLQRVERALAGTGLQLQVFVSSGDHDAEMAVMRRARVVIGPHGGALANLVFAQPGTHVIEFLPIRRLLREGKNPRPSYWGLAQAAGLDYWTVEPDQFDFDKPGMVVNEQEVVEILDQVLPRRGHATKRALGTVRDKVLLLGAQGYRKPRLFDWTHDESEATARVVVVTDGEIHRALRRPGRKIAWIKESPAISVWQRVTPWVLDNLEEVAEAYELILTSDRALCSRHPKIRYHPAAANLPWPWIDEQDWAIHPKSKLCSMFASPKTMVEGHEIRHRYAHRLKHEIDLFGGAFGSPRIGGQGQHPDKSEGLLPYMFHVAMENCRVDLYYTEKLTDCFACGTVPVYWGSPAISEIFDTGGIITLDEDFHVDSLSEERYRAMLPAIRNNLDAVRSLELADDLLYRLYVADR